jgi:hypothetical protein
MRIRMTREPDRTLLGIGAALALAVAVVLVSATQIRRIEARAAPPPFRFHRTVDGAMTVCFDVPVSGQWRWRCLSVGRLRQLAVAEGGTEGAMSRKKPEPVEPYVPTVPPPRAYVATAADRALAVRTLEPVPHADGAVQRGPVLSVVVDRRTGRQVVGFDPRGALPPLAELRNAGPGFPWTDATGHAWDAVPAADGGAPVWQHALTCCCAAQPEAPAAVPLTERVVDELGRLLWTGPYVLGRAFAFGDQRVREGVRYTVLSCLLRDDGVHTVLRRLP